MSTKKSTTKQSTKSNQRKGAASKQKSATDQRREIARHVAAIFRNPETPVRLYNALAEAMNDLFNDIPTSSLDESEDYNFRLLEEYAKSQEGGAR